MKFVLDYIRLILFSFGLLIGLQLPAVVDQYSKRVDAHYTEAKQNLAGFQLTAERYFDGSIEKLINHYTNSEDAVFRQDAQNIAFIFNRVKLLDNELIALERSAVSRTFHVLFSSDPTLFDETMQQYTYAILLTPQALLWALFVAFVCAISVEALVRLLISLFHRYRSAAE